MELCRDPFVVGRTVRWSDCDPAGVVYTGRFTDYVLDALADFMMHLNVGPGSNRREEDMVGMPMKHMEMTYNVSLYPGDSFDMHILVGEIRSRSFQVKLAARLPDGQIAFEAVCTPICIALSERKSVQIPLSVRADLELHQRFA